MHIYSYYYLIEQWHSCDSRRGWPPPSSSAESAESGLTPTRPTKWHSPTPVSDSLANSTGKNIRKLYRDGLIMKRQVHMHSRARVRAFHEAKRKGRHTGYGKRKGTKDARMPQKVLWMRRQRVLRRLLRKYRASKKITKDIYHHFYLAAKGNQFKNKTVLIEAIHKMKQEKIREKQLEEQKEARRAKNAEKKQKRLNKKLEGFGRAAPPKEVPQKEEVKKAEPKKKEEVKKEAPKKQEPKKDAKKAPAGKAKAKK